MNSPDLNLVVSFLWSEADLLDAKDYEAWLSLWTDDGLYIIPMREGVDYCDELNYAYDDGLMRRMRVARLVGGQSMSANEPARTVRTLSRFRIQDDAPPGQLRVRCAQHLAECRRGHQAMLAADVTYDLVPSGSSFQIARKLVVFINAEDGLHSLTYLP